MARRVLVPLDRSKSAESALKVLPEVCEKGDEVILLSIAEPEREMQIGLRPGRVIRGTNPGSGGGGGIAAFARPDMPIYGETGDQAIQRQLDELQDYLSPKARELTAQGFNVDMAFEISNHPAEAIVEVARKCTPSFIVMARTAHPGVAERLFGTVAQQVIREDVAPVMILPGQP
jgi:nucleotide-binding universal stress UspA family protein